MRTLHLFAGAGGGLLADLILGHTPVGAIEQDRYRCQVLRERVTDGWFPGLQVTCADIRDCDPENWRGRVDCIHAGFPCQDLSLAGKGAGLSGARSGLWSEVVRFLRVIRPRHAFLENVPGLVPRGLGTVRADLAAVGFDAEWQIISAADVGAPHIRKRWWCLATNTDGDALREQPKRDQRQGRCERTTVGAEPVAVDNGAAGDMADAARHDTGRTVARSEREQEPTLCNTDGARPPKRESVGGNDGEEFPPVVGTGWWGSEPAVGRVADGVADRVQRIAALGDGQVPLSASAAWIALGGPLPEWLAGGE